MLQRSYIGELEANNASTGWIRSRIGTAGAIANTQNVEFALRYPGQQFDKETGLMYNHHRYYDPYLTVGYTETDPIGLAGGWNRLRYAGGDGINNFDMTGLKGWYCQRGLNQEPGTSGKPLLNHQYLCVTQNNQIYCGGLTTDGNILSSPGRLTTPKEDYYHPNSCKLVDDDSDQCFEQCVLKNFKKTE